ncbi:malate transporter [Mycoplasma miroungigenitalium]|uniref:Malate transporter n=1 Tax=Mycoplasma miroungigenitalium TaxID=754515 RepID=A0A6M4JAX9_9MOLU|nr:malate transporter [Mycoplasma miroungigenitalium]QJR43545.1 malate transporter [Mycoplasma miroungigenitalium]
MENLVKLLKSQNLYGAVIATMFFVLVGFFVTKKGIFTKEINGKISTFLLQWALPFLCIVAFMAPAKADVAKEVGIVIGLSAAFYILIAVYNTLIIKFVPRSRLVSAKIRAQAEKMYEQSDKSQSPAQFREAQINSYTQKLLTSQMMLAYASLQFFAVPLVKALGAPVFNTSATALLQVWNLPYMIGAFTYVKMAYSGQKFSRNQIKPILNAIFNPMMICLYVSAILWALQFIPAIPKFNAAGEWYSDTTNGTLQFWHAFGSQIPMIIEPIKKMVDVISPLAWIVIGGSLATSNLKEAAKDKEVWITTIRKALTIPVVMLLVCLPFVKFGLLSVSTGTLLVILGACPPAAVTIIFSVAFKHEHTPYTAQVSSLSTLVSLIALPVWTVASYGIFNALVA